MQPAISPQVEFELPTAGASTLTFDIKMKTKTLLVFLLLLLPCVFGAEKAAETREHALRYFSGTVVRASVSKSYYWQSVAHSCPTCNDPIHDIITVFKVEESYSGGVPVGTEICCFHRSQTEKSLKPGDVCIFPATAPISQVQHLDTGDLVPVAEISKRQR